MYEKIIFRADVKFDPSHGTFVVMKSWHTHEENKS